MSARAVPLGSALLLLTGCGGLPAEAPPTATQRSPLRIDAPLFGQASAPWGGDTLGHCTPGVDTLANQGCLVTSMAMLYSYYSPGWTNPGELNGRLTHEGGFAACRSGGVCCWPWAAPYAPPGVRYAGGRAFDAAVVADELAAGRPVITVTYSIGQHWFLITGRDDDGEFVVHDPLGQGSVRRLSDAGYRPARIQLYHGEPRGQVFECEWRAQNPDTPGPLSLAPGEQRPAEMVYRNTGTAPWTRVGAGERAADGLVLSSVDRNGRVVDSFLAADGWFDRKTATSIGRGVERVAPGQDAIFTFDLEVPADAAPGERRVYFMPVHQRLGENPGGCWGEAHFWIDVTAPDPDATDCEPGASQSQACDGEGRGACDPGSRRRVCGGDGLWADWGGCDGRVEPQPETLDGRDNDCDGTADELWRPIVRCHRDGVFRYRDARDGTCFDGWEADNGGRPYFHLHKTAGGERIDRTARLHNDFHACRGQLLSFFENPAGDGAAGWNDAGATWYAVSDVQRAAHPDTVAIHRLERDVAECGNPRYLFLPAGGELDAAREAGWRVSDQPAFFAWP